MNTLINLERHYRNICGSLICHSYNMCDTCYNDAFDAYEREQQFSLLQDSKSGLNIVINKLISQETEILKLKDDISKMNTTLTDLSTQLLKYVKLQNDKMERANVKRAMKALGKEINENKK
jgi:hypothetical protein